MKINYFVVYYSGHVFEHFIDSESPLLISYNDQEVTLKDSYQTYDGENIETTITISRDKNKVINNQLKYLEEQLQSIGQAIEKLKNQKV